MTTNKLATPAGCRGRALGLQLVLLECAEALNFRCPAAQAEHGRQVMQDFVQAHRSGEHPELDGAGIPSRAVAEDFLEIHHFLSASSTYV